MFLLVLIRFRWIFLGTLGMAFPYPYTQRLVVCVRAVSVCTVFVYIMFVNIPISI